VVVKATAPELRIGYSTQTRTGQFGFEHTFSSDRNALYMPRKFTVRSSNSFLELYSSYGRPSSQGKTYPQDTYHASIHAHQSFDEEAELEESLKHVFATARHRQFELYNRISQYDAVSEININAPIITGILQEGVRDLLQTVPTLPGAVPPELRTEADSDASSE
jgi:hypothetical protein